MGAGHRAGGAHVDREVERGDLLRPIMSGELGDVLLPELVQMLVLGGHTLRVVVRGRSGRVGVLWIDGGRVRHCRVDDLIGEVAFHTICCSVGTFEVYRSELGGPETITCSWQHLLFEAARLQDEAERAAEVLWAEGDLRDDSSTRSASEHPSVRASSVLAELLRDSRVPLAEPGPSPLIIPRPAAVPREVQPIETEAFETLFGEAIYAYLCRQLNESERLFRRCALLRPNDERVNTNLRRLANRRGRRP